MLKLVNITKQYTLGGNTIDALRGIDLEFRENEFVSILGPSGCGKTTTLNIIGGLDRYTSGDLIINGRSTKEYKDGDWDAYRNHSIGFVFQSYNLIPHQTVLANVELALTLAGVSRAERRRRAVEALERVGLGDQLSKVPSQMSGGQMQRVAIARALINDPDILLADEPTGALDSETSVQVMELLKEVARDRLVIMVTHNPELAQQYSTRIVTLKDGRVTGDSNPYHSEADAPVLTGREARADKKPSMSFLTALSLSLTNLRTKMGRTVLTAFAGSIGIIGIALILALSTGINTYINKVQEDTLSSYPITIQAESTDMTALMASLMGARHSEAGGAGGGAGHDPDRVYASTVMYDMMDSMLNAEVETNNLEAFKEYLDNGGGGIRDMANVHYSYDFDFDIYTQDENGDIIKCDVMTLMQDAMTAMYGGDYSSYFEQMGSMYSAMDVWEELLPGEDGELVAPQVKADYELLCGDWPQSHDEVILFVDGNNEISDLMLYALGLMPHDDMEEAMVSMSKGEAVDAPDLSWSYEELCGLGFKLILPAEYYQHDPVAGTYTDMSATETGMDFLYNSEDTGIRLKIAGIARPAGDGNAMGGGMTSGGIGYTSALTRFAIETTGETEILKAQLADPDTDVISALPFPKDTDVEPTDGEKAQAIAEHLSTLSAQDKAAAYVDVMGQPSSQYVDAVVEQQMAGMTRESIEEMIVQQYAGEMGVDGDTVRGYIADMSDEELFDRVEEAIAQAVREQYAAGVEARLGSQSADQLAAMMDLTLEQGITFVVTVPNEPEAPLSESAGMDAGMAGMGGSPSMSAPSPFTPEQFVYLYDHYMPPTRSSSTYEDNLDLLGYTRLDSPSAISIYATTFAQKDEIADLIQEYNDGVDSEEDEITYTDYVALLMSSITGIISGISYLLIAFVSISLVVSSIMIGIITNISVLERTKEIGILRAVGASKRDVSRVFNAETLIVGLAAGLLGILVSVLATFPINAVIHDLTGLDDLTAVLPTAAGAVLVAISVVLTVFAGLVPSRGAAKKDPVEALRSE